MEAKSLLKYSGVAAVPCLLVVFLLLLPSESTAQDEISIGATLPQANRTLQNANGPSTSLAEAAGEQGLVVIFWSNQSRWVGRYESRVISLAREFQDRGIGFVLVNSNDAGAYPQESLENMRQRAQQENYPMTYLKDSGSEVARAFGATHTPHVFLFNGSRSLVYKGGIDDSPTEPSQVTEPYLRNALEALLEGESIPTAETQPFGSTIKFGGG